MIILFTSVATRQKYSPAIERVGDNFVNTNLKYYRYNVLIAYSRNRNITK